MASGFVYIWRDARDRRFYIGSHMGPMDDGYICSSVGKTGMRHTYLERPQDFRRRILELVSTGHADLLKAEQRWLDMVPRADFGGRYYNLSASVRGMLLLSPEAQKEARRKAGLANRGRKHGPRSEEWCRKISEGRKGKGVGRVFSDETREKIRVAVTGKKHSEETKQKISKNTRKQFSDPSAREAQAVRYRGKKLPREHRANISAGLMGRPGWAAGTIWITDGMIETKVPKDRAMPNGFVRGRKANNHGVPQW